MPSEIQNFMLRLLENQELSTKAVKCMKFVASSQPHTQTRSFSNSGIKLKKISNKDFDRNF